jgi:hypothetical protein
MPEMRCKKAMWDGFGMPAGLCGNPAYGDNSARLKETETDYEYPNNRRSKFTPLTMACPRHGGPDDPAILSEGE